MKTSSPNLIGTRTNAFFLNNVGPSSCSITFAINRRIALDPISIAAYFFMVSTISRRVYLRNNRRLQIVIL